MERRGLGGCRPTHAKARIRWARDSRQNRPEVYTHVVAILLGHFSFRPVAGLENCETTHVFREALRLRKSDSVRKNCAASEKTSILRRPEPVKVPKAPSRLSGNENCPCGSGKKYKKRCAR